MIRAQFLLFTAMLVGSSFFYQPRDYDNTKSRYMLLGAIVDEGRLTIDSKQGETVDKSVSNGHYYSNKAIGLPLISVPGYYALKRWVLRPASRAPGASILDDMAGLYLVRVLTVSIPFAFLGVLLFRFLLDLHAPPRHALWAVLSYAFGTIALNHATIFSGHQTSAFFLFSSFLILFQISREGASAGGRSTALGLLAGLCAGCAVLCDYIAVFSALVLTWYALRKSTPLASKIGFVAGAFLCACVLAWYNLSCFGAINSLSYAHNWFPSFNQGAAVGAYGISWPHPLALLELLGSASRGFFFISPVFIFCMPGWIFLSRRPQYKAESGVILWSGVLTLLANAGFYAWHGGWTFGPRYLIPILPFLAVPLALTADGGPWFVSLFVLSIFQVGCAQLGWPHVMQDIRNPVVEFMLPLMREGGTSLNFLGGAHPGAWGAGLGQYAIIGILGALAFGGLPGAKRRHLPWRWKASIICWTIFVAAALLTIRTRDQLGVHYYRGILLNDAAWETGSSMLSAAGARERALADASGPYRPLSAAASR
jgi:hypothetical protein